MSEIYFLSAPEKYPVWRALHRETQRNHRETQRI